MALDLDQSLTLTDSGDLLLVSGDNALAQRLVSRTSTQEGEWPFDTRYGMPWLFSVLGQKADSAGARAILAQKLQADPDVSAVDRIDFTFDSTTRVASISVSVRSISGDIVTTG
jgi:hypothetical protein